MLHIDVTLGDTRFIVTQEPGTGTEVRVKHGNNHSGKFKETLMPTRLLPALLYIATDGTGEGLENGINLYHELTKLFDNEPETSPIP